MLAIWPLAILARFCWVFGPPRAASALPALYTRFARASHALYTPLPPGRVWPISNSVRVFLLTKPGRQAYVFTDVAGYVRVLVFI